MPEPLHKTAEPLIASLENLLNSLGCSDENELGLEVEDRVEMDAHVEVLQHGLSFVVDGFTAELSYPFTPSHFWEVVDTLDDWCWEEHEADVLRGKTTSPRLSEGSSPMRAAERVTPAVRAAPPSPGP